RPLWWRSPSRAAGKFFAGRQASEYRNARGRGLRPGQATDLPRTRHRSARASANVVQAKSYRPPRGIAEAVEHIPNSIEEAGAAFPFVLAAKLFRERIVALNRVAQKSRRRLRTLE